MDWLQFTASIIGSLAWPVVALIVIFLSRKQVAPLIERLIEMTLPGGAKFVFAKQIERGRISSREVDAVGDEELTELSDKLLATASSPRANAQGATYEPQAKIVNAFREVEQVLAKFKTPLQLPESAPSSVIVGKLEKKGLIEPNVRELFMSVFQARNIGVHLGPGQVSPFEAVDLIRQAAILKGQFEAVYKEVTGKKK